MGCLGKACLGWPGLAAFLALLAAPCWPYRPFSTEDAGVAGKGVVQLEASADYMDWSNGDKESIFLLVPILGVTELFELSMEIPRMGHDDQGAYEDGLGDISIVGKYLLLPAQPTAPSVALKGVLKAATGDSQRGLGSGQRDLGMVVAASHALGSLALHAQLGYLLSGAQAGGAVRDIALYGLALDWNPAWALHLGAEVAGSTHPDRPSSQDPLSVLLGLAWAFSEKCVLDIGLRRGLNQDVPVWSATGGISLGL